MGVAVDDDRARRERSSDQEDLALAQELVPERVCRRGMNQEQSSALLVGAESAQPLGQRRPA